MTRWRFVKDHPGWAPATLLTFANLMAALGREAPTPGWLWALCFVWFVPVLLTSWERNGAAVSARRNT